MESKLNYPDLSALLAKQCGITLSKAETFSKAFFDVIIEGVEKDGQVKINGLGVFKIVDVANRSSVDVNTGAKIEIKGHRKLTFIPADVLKEKVNQPFAMFEPVEVNDDYVDDDESAVVADESAVETLEKSVAEPVAKSEQPSLEVVPEQCDGTVEVKTEADSDKIAEVNELAIPKEHTASVADDMMGGEITCEEVAEQQYNSVEERGEEGSNVKLNIEKNTDNSTIEKSVDPTLKRALYLLLLVLFAGVAYWYFAKGDESSMNSDSVSKQTVADGKNTSSEPIVVPISDTIVEKIDTVEEYRFVMIEELANTPLSAITMRDTLLYRADGDITLHKVELDETLTKIALKYYNDKKLWPYIVNHNNMGNHNSLEIGMELAIPKLVQRK